MPRDPCWTARNQQNCLNKLGKSKSPSKYANSNWHKQSYGSPMKRSPPRTPNLKTGKNLSPSQASNIIKRLYENNKKTENYVMSKNTRTLYQKLKNFFKKRVTNNRR